MKILTDLQREALVKVIAEAPDDLLLQAAESVKQYRLSIQRGFESIRGYVGMKETVIGQQVSKGTNAANGVPSYAKVSLIEIVAPTIEAFTAALEGSKDTTMTLPTIEEPKPNVEPTGEAAYKVGGKSKDTILLVCKIPKTLEQINNSLGRGKGKLDETASLLKRLWTLGEVKFDGVCYLSK
jgi:hypothetical protein